MSHYEKRLERDLTQLRDKVRTMGEMVEQMLGNAVHSLLTGNSSLANNTVLSDHPINRAMREIDRLCHAFIALHLPSAGHLRFISSVIRLGIELERIGDYAVTICRQSLLLSHTPQGLMTTEVESIANEAQRMLHQALSAFHDENVEVAKATKGMSDHLETTLDSLYGNLMTGEHTKSNQDMFAILNILSMLKRTADQAKNICEEAVFAVSGETKAKKTYKILFLDKDNSCLSQMAVAIARKNFPNSGSYSGAGRRKAHALNPAMSSFLEQKGFDMVDVEPVQLELTTKELAEHQVIISLEGPVTDHIPEAPFHTVTLDWDSIEAPDGLDETQTTQRIEEMYRYLSVQIKNLMEILRGEGAD